MSEPRAEGAPDGAQERCRKPGCGSLKGRCMDWDCPEGAFVQWYEGRQYDTLAPQPQGDRAALVEELRDHADYSRKHGNVTLDHFFLDQVVAARRRFRASAPSWPPPGRAEMDRTVATMHSLERTSPMGGPFVGRCVLCGREGLTLASMEQECMNAARITQEDALLDALKGEREHG